MDSFAPLLGQPQAIELLTQAVRQQRIAPAYLFVGTPGVGRSLAARCFLELLFSQPHPGGQSRDQSRVRRRIEQRNHPDLLWVEPTYLHQGKRLTAAEAEATGLKRRGQPLIRLEQIREMTQFLSRAPLEASRSAVVLEQADTMAEPAANALLKTLEEPGQATLILIAPGVESLLPTLVSRCQRIPFFGLPDQLLAQILQQTGHSEILHQSQLLALAQGSPGRAIASWQQLQQIPPDLLQALAQPPRNLRTALTLARQISRSLESETQLWLLDYLQQSYWQQAQAQQVTTVLQHLEQAKQYLLRYVPALLVWEVTLMAIATADSF